MKKIEVECTGCKTKLIKNKGDYNKNIKKGMSFWCSNKCQAKFAPNKKFCEKGPRALVEYWKTHSPRDEFYSFRNHMIKINKHVQTYANRKHPRIIEVSVTLQDLKDQWDKQNGKCIFSGVDLIPSKRTGNSRHYHRASLDRIDSSKGYIPGNIQFVSMIAQYGKNEWSNAILIDFCKQVSYNQSEDNEEHF